MKSLFLNWLVLRLYLVLGLTARYFFAYTVSKHWNVPIEDALLGVLLFTSTWTDNCFYFHSKPNPAPKESPTHAQLQHATQFLRSNPRG